MIFINIDMILGFLALLAVIFVPPLSYKDIPYADSFKHWGAMLLLMALLFISVTFIFYGVIGLFQGALI